MMALIAVSRKLLRIIFAIVRDDTEFIMNHESQRKEEMRKAAFLLPSSLLSTKAHLKMFLTFFPYEHDNPFK